MVNRFSKLFALVLALLLCLTGSSALAANHVESIDVDVILYRDGSARVLQTWWGDFDEGTECYLPINDSGYLVVSDLEVYSDETDFQTLPSWDVDASFDEKKARCGIVETDNGYELCWGITHYGRHGYQIAYTVENIARSFDESDGFNFMFVNRGLNTTPTNVTVRIMLEDGTPLTAENSAIWAFGYEGQIQFEDGGVYAWSEKPITKNDCVIIMLEMEKGLLTPAMRAKGSFEAVREKALKGSDYDGGGMPIGLIAGIAAAIAALIGLGIYSGRKRKKKLQEINAKYGVFAGLPTDDEIAASWQMGNFFGLCEKNALVGALMMVLLRDGCLQLADDDFEPDGDSEVYLIQPPASRGAASALYALLEDISYDGSVRSSEADDYFYHYPETLERLIKRCEKYANRWFENNGCFNGVPCSSFKSLTQQGEEVLGRLLGLKQFLTDDSIDPQSVEITLTPEDCYAYGILFGLKDAELEKIRAFYPAYTMYFDRYHHYYYYSYYYGRHAYAGMNRAQSERSQGSGGSSSHSGGGGFSGGGSGGGTR